MIKAEDFGPFRTLMSDLWNESGDLYLDSFENAFEILCNVLTDSDKRRLLSELEIVSASGLIGDLKTDSGRQFWNSLGRRVLTHDEFLVALSILKDKLNKKAN